MTVLIVESNLIWSSRLSNSVRSLGHEPFVLLKCDESVFADLAILNLSSPNFQSDLEFLKGKGIRTIAHAGHKEHEKLELGKIAGVDKIVSNSELTFKLETILAECALER